MDDLVPKKQRQKQPLFSFTPFEDRSNSENGSSAAPPPSLSELQKKSDLNSRYDPKKKAISSEFALATHAYVPLKRNTEGLSAYERHVRYMSTYARLYFKSNDGTGGEKKLEDALEQEHNKRWMSRYESDRDVIARNYKFLGPDDDYEPSADAKQQEDQQQEGQQQHQSDSWEKRLVAKYYSKLFREYCLVSLSRYKEGKVGMRWRTKEEVVQGKGQFICGCLECLNRDVGVFPSSSSSSSSSSSATPLKTYEVNFKYSENQITKNALVKLRLCSSCAEKMNYKKSEDKKLQAKQEKDKQKKKKRDGEEGQQHDRQENERESSGEKNKKARKEKTNALNDDVQVKKEEEEEEEIDDELSDLFV